MGKNKKNIASLSIQKSSLHEARRLARIYGAIHDVSYNDVIGLALKAYIDPARLKEETVEFLKQRQLPTSWKDKILKGGGK